MELSPSRLSDIEAGNTNLSFNTLLAISNRFSISLDWLVAGKGDIFFKQQKKILMLDYIPMKLNSFNNIEN